MKRQQITYTPDELRIIDDNRHLPPLQVQKLLPHLSYARVAGLINRAREKDARQAVQPVGKIWTDNAMYGYGRLDAITNKGTGGYETHRTSRKVPMPAR
jgi:hypothetical protein